MTISSMTKSGADMSTLFSSLPGNSSGNVASSNFLSDYYSIKNGSYLKALKAYYGTGSSTSVNNKNKATNSTSISDDDAKTLADIEKTSEAVKDSASALYSSKSLFSQKDITSTDSDGKTSTKKGYDVNAIYDAVNSFVKDYNAMIDSVGKASSGTLENQASRLVRATASNSKLLGAVGMGLNADGTLSLNEDTFKKADMATAKSLFSGNGSFAYQVATSASMINYYADNEASKTNTYTANGSYSGYTSTGSILSSTV